MVTRGRRGDGWQREGEENFIPIDKDIFNPLSLHCRTHAWDGDERERRQPAPMMRMVAPHLCIVLYSVCVST